VGATKAAVKQLAAVDVTKAAVDATRAAVGVKERATAAAAAVIGWS
jgi:hypothetical protein